MQPGATESGPDTRLVVFKAALGDPFGVLIDRVGGVAALRPDQIEADRPAETDSPADGLVCGVGKLDGELITLLDAGKILPAVERSLAAGRRADRPSYDGDGFMNNLRLRTKLGLLVGVLAATTVTVAAVGYYQLAARQRPTCGTWSR